MLAGDFARKLKKLNKHLEIIPNDNPAFPAGLFYVSDNDRIHICGVDKNELPLHPRHEGRFMVKGGYLRPLKILVSKQLVDRHAVYRVFGLDLAYNRRPARHRWVDPIEEALKEARALGKEKAQRKAKDELADVEDGKKVNYMELDDLLQIARMRRKARGE